MTSPEMTPVDSTSIEAVGYDENAHELYVRFLGGRTYVYSGVSTYTHDAFLSAPSKGSYLNREVKPNHEARLAQTGG